MKIRTILIDDEPLATANLTNLLSKVSNDIHIIGCADTIEDAIELIYIEKPELIFLDVELPGGSGFDILNRIKNKNFEVILVTAFNQFALKAIKNNILDYILKPIDKIELLEVIEKAKVKIHNNRLLHSHVINQEAENNFSNQKIALPTLEGLIFVEIADIIYCESSGRYTIFHFIDETHKMVSKNLGEYEVLFESHNFARIHNQYLVNLQHIKKYVKGRGGYVVLSNGKMLDVSVRKKDDFFDKFEK